MDSFEQSAPLVPDYELLRRIGAGAYGEIWLARSTATGVLRAAKIVWRRSFDSDRPFQREFEGIQKFERISREHPSQLALFHIGRNDTAGYFYSVMELADALENPKSEGRDPKEIRNPNTETTVAPNQLRASDFGLPSDFALRASDFYIPHTLRAELERGRVPASRVLEIGLALSEALAHLHSHGLVHRDVKPSNVIFVNGRPKLADIGLVTDASDSRSFVGTEGYLPPEGPGTAQADLFALGKVLYEGLTGLDRREFPRLPEDLRNWPDVQQVFEINEIILRACAAGAQQRYQSAEEMRRELTLLQHGRSVKGRHAWRRRAQAARRIGLAAAAMAVVAAAVVFLWQALERRRSVPLSELMPADAISGTRNNEARQAYTSGLIAMRWGTLDGFLQAHTNFTAAIKADPQFVAAHARLFEIYLMSQDYDVHETPPDRAEQLNKLSENLARLAPTNAETYAARAIVLFLNDWKWTEAEEKFKQALTVDPDCRMALTYYGYMLTRQLRYTDARERLERALKKYRDWPIIAKFLGHCEYVQHQERHYKEALRLYDLAGNGPSYPGSHYWAGRANLALGNYGKALDEFEEHERRQAFRPSSGGREVYTVLQEALAADPERGRGYWLKSLKLINDTPENVPYWYAECHARLGHKTQALEGLKRAVEQRDTVEDLLADEFWDAYREEPEFKRALQTVGLDRWAR